MGEEELTPVPGHINTVTGGFCSREGQLAPGGRCPDGCDHADHYSNDGHPECEDIPTMGERCPHGTVETANVRCRECNRERAGA